MGDSIPPIYFCSMSPGDVEYKLSKISFFVKNNSYQAIDYCIARYLDAIEWITEIYLDIK